MYTNIKTILENASANNYAVIATSPLNMELARGMMRAAEAKKAPIIFLMGQNIMRQHAKAELIIPMVKKLANEFATVPVATCLDHGNQTERLFYAFRNDVSSIMYDGSLLPFDENMRNTRKVVEICHQFDMGVEGELGHVGQAANGDEKDESIYTSPEDAKRFVDGTGVDCLAIAVGTAHGEYPKGLIPHINFQRIREIKAITEGLPLALHGGSGSGDENIVKAVEAGINKVNMVTDVFVNSREVTKRILQENPKVSYIDLMSQVEESVKVFVEHWIDLTGSAGKSALFDRENRMGLMTPKGAIGAGE